MQGKAALLNRVVKGDLRAEWLKDDATTALGYVDGLLEFRRLASLISTESSARLEEFIGEFETLAILRFGVAYDTRDSGAMQVRGDSDYLETTATNNPCLFRIIIRS